MCSPQEEEEEGEKEKTHRERKCVGACVYALRGDGWPRLKKGEIASREVAKKARGKKDFGKKDLVEGTEGDRRDRARSNLRFILTYSYAHERSVSLSLWYYSTAVTRSASIPAFK